MEIRYANRMQNVKPSAIRELAKLISQKPGTISFAGGWPAPELFPVEEMKVVCQKVMEEDGRAALQYTTTEGFVPLRKFISERMAKYGVDIDAQNIMIISGSQQGLEYSAKIFVNEGDVVICENPSYVGAINAFKQFCPKFVGIPMDQDGMIMEELEKALKANPNAKFIYTIPDNQNPTGITMSLERRQKLVELAAEYNVPVVEDNPYRELIYDGESLPAVKHFDKYGIVIFLGTFSKTFCPGLRLGWVAAEPEILRKYTLIKQGADLQAGTLDQRLAAKFMELYDFDEHVKSLIKVYKKRRDLMLDTMEKEFPDTVKYTYPKGGLFTWVDLPEGIDASELLKKAIEEGVAFVSGEPFYPNGGNKNHFRLNYGTMPEKKIAEGIKSLGKVLKSI
jgi:2-aminoadipate transaminase